MKTGTILTILGALGLTYLLTGCQATPAQEVVFIQQQEKKLQNYDFLPVDKAWYDPEIDFKKYTKIIVEPVITSKRIKQSDLEKANLDSFLGTDKEKALEFVKYTQNAFEKAIQNDTRLQLAEKPGPDTMILQIALVKVVPGKAVVGAVKNIPMSRIGLIIAPATSAAGGSMDGPLQSSVAIEGRLLDSQSKQVIAAFADREKEKTAVFNLRDFRAYGTPEQLVDEWAALFVKALNRKPGEEVKPKARVKIINF